MRSLALAITLALAVAVPAASAANSRSLDWARVDGPTKAGTQLGLLPSGGVLHVVWAQGSPAVISDTELNGDGKSVKTVPITSNFDGIGGLSLVGMADGSVRLFVAGGTRPGLPSSLAGINSFVAPPGADGWTLDPTALWGGAVASAADDIGAAVSGGNPITAWSGGFVHVGLGAAASGDPSYQPDCERGKLRHRSASPRAWDVRRLHRHDEPGDQALPVRRGDANDREGLVPHREGVRGPAGRLWMLWGDANNGVWVTRSNKAVTRWEPVQKLSLPGNTTAFYNAQGEGSACPLDAFVDLLIGTTDRGFWRAHVLARDTLAASTSYQSGGKGKTAHLAFRATDAGDPLTGAIIVVARGGTVIARLRTDSSGRATTSLLLGNLRGRTSLKATVTAPGYAAQTISVGLAG